MRKELRTYARLSRALTQENSRYQRVLSRANRMSKEELAHAAANLLLLLIRERAFSNVFKEIEESNNRRDTKGIRTENILYRTAGIIDHTRRSKGGKLTSSLHAGAREAVKAAWKKVDQRGRGTKARFSRDQAGEHDVDPKTILNWLK